MADLSSVFDRVLGLVEGMEKAQADKVIALARRLKPGLTAEDIKNPHDFPDLDDPDWHFEDGQLAGIQAVSFALRAMQKEQQEGAAHGQAGQDQEGPPQAR